MKGKRILAMAMALTLMTPAVALADASTTQGRTAYKDLNARTEVYAVSDTAGADYPFYGMKWEPNGGVYYGRTAKGGSTPDGYGLANAEALANESIVSYYYGTNDMTSGYDLEYWSYIYGKALEDGEHALLICLNFDKEGADCANITSGNYDSRLVSDLQYLHTLTHPVFLRIGGEVNVWGNMPSAQQYKEAYQHIAKLARTHAPNVALVYSPNFSSAYKVDVDSFYPGDTYVDWVGCSLYYNKVHHNPNLKNQDAFLGVGVYGDPMLNVQQTINLANLHKRPVILTEGGSTNKFADTDLSAWAAERTAKACSFLPMVYPQIKAMVLSDYGVAWAKTDYTFYNNAVVKAAYDKAVHMNPVLLHNHAEQGKYYTRLSAYPQKWTGTVVLGCYTYAPEKQTANLFIDGKWTAGSATYPYRFAVDTTKLTPGNHTLKVSFTNGVMKTYDFTV